MKQFDLMAFLPIVLIFVVMYFLVIRPQSKKAKAHQEMINSLKKGDKIVTSGGLIGVITQVNETELELQIAPSVRIMVARPMVANLVSSDNKVTEPVTTTKVANKSKK